MNTGLLRGEALALHWSDIDLDAKLLWVRGTLARVSGELVDRNEDAQVSPSGPLSPTAERLLRDVRANQRAERLRAGSMWQPNAVRVHHRAGEPCDPRNALRAAERRSQARPAAFLGRMHKSKLQISDSSTPQGIN